MSTPAGNIGAGSASPPPGAMSGSEGGGQGNGQGQGQPPSSLTPGQGFSQPSIPTPTPTAQPVADPLGGQAQQAPATPDPSQFYSKWGGENRITQGMSIYDLLAGDQFQAAAVNDALYKLSQERYGAIGDDMFEQAPDYFIAKAVEKHNDKLLQALGWDPQAYNDYKQWRESGGQLQNQPPDPRDTRLQQLESQFQQQQEQQVMAERQGKWQDFTTRLAEPINNLIRELNLPNNEEGQLWAEMLSSGTQGLFSADKDAMAAMQTAEQYFRNGEYELGLQKFDQIKAAAELKARKIATLVGRAIKGLSAEQQQTLAHGQAQINPNGTTVGQAATPQNAFQSNELFGHGPLSYEALKPELDQMLAQRQRR